MVIKKAEFLGERSLFYRFSYHFELQAPFLSWWVATAKSPEQIVAIGEDFHSQVDDGKVLQSWISIRKYCVLQHTWPQSPEQIVVICEDFHSQVGDGKVRTTLYKVRCQGYDKKDDTWEPITHLQGYATMVKTFKESKLWTRPWKTHWRQQSMPNCRLLMTKESSPMMMTHTGNASSLRWQEVGRRKSAEEVVVIWTYSVALVWLVWYVSKRL